MKILNSTHISPFGGLNFVIDTLDKLGIGNLLNKELNSLPSQSQYDWRDILYSCWSIFFCGGNRLEDIGTNLGGFLSGHPYLNVPSPDTLAKRLKELNFRNKSFTTKRSDIIHRTNQNTQLNKLLLKVLKKTSPSFCKRKDLTLDFDNTIIFCNKSDSKPSYKKAVRGYNPGVGIIDNNIVFIEQRNGNCPAYARQDIVLKELFNSLSKSDILIDRFRADGASFSKDVLSFLEKQNVRRVRKYGKSREISFFIRAKITKHIRHEISSAISWNEVTKEGDPSRSFRTELHIPPFIYVESEKKKIPREKLKSYRVIVTKIKRENQQLSLFKDHDYFYSAILTNDMKLSNDQVVEFYNKRGAAEKEFDVLKNDFGWDSLPFSKMKQNTVFLIVMAMCRNIYNALIAKYHKTTNGLEPKSRMKRFIFKFICIPAKWIYQSRTWVLRLYGSMAFKT